VSKDVLGESVDENTIERLCQDAGCELSQIKENDWKEVLTGEVIAPELAIVEFDGGRIRTRQEGCGTGVHLEGKGWNETKNVVFVSATCETSVVDPQPEPPECFRDRKHVAKLAEQAIHREKCEKNRQAACDADAASAAKQLKQQAKDKSHKPKRILRTVLSSMRNVKSFGIQMQREAKRRKFHDAVRRAFVAMASPAIGKYTRLTFPRSFRFSTSRTR